MKHAYKFLLLITALTAITACSKSNSGTPTHPAPSLLVGKWTIVSDTIRLYSGDTLKQTQATPGLTPADYTLFNADGSGSTAEDGFTDNFTYKFSGSTLTINTPAQIIESVQEPAGTEIADVKTLTAGTLHIYTTGIDTIDYKAYIFKEDIHFTK
jgi:hypothetical protein